MTVSTASYFYPEDRYNLLPVLFSGVYESASHALASDPESVLDALSIWVFSHRPGGTATLVRGDQTNYFQIKGLLSLSEQRLDERFINLILQYSTLLGVTENQSSRHRSSFLDYMRQVEIWAEAYAHETVVITSEEIEAIYDDAFFEAMDLEKKLP